MFAEYRISDGLVMAYHSSLTEPSEGNGMAKASLVNDLEAYVSYVKEVIWNEEDQTYYVSMEKSYRK